MITFWSIPRDFVGEFDELQRRAIRSWRAIAPSADIVLVGEDVHLMDFYAEIGAEIIPTVAQNKFGTPLINDAIKRADAAGDHEMMCMISADIVLDESFLCALTIIADIPHPFVIGRRTDIAEDGSQTLHAPCGIDYFIYRRGTLGDVPPFAVGRTAYDNWLVYDAIWRRMTVIDATGAINAYHLHHGYGKWESQAAMRAGAERAENLRLAGGNMCTIADAPYVIRDGEVVRRG